MNRLICEYPDAIPLELCQTLIERFDSHQAHPDGRILVEDKLRSDGGMHTPGRRPPKKASVIYLSRRNAVEADPMFAEAVSQFRERLADSLDAYWDSVGRMLGIQMTALVDKQLDFIKYSEGIGYYDAHVDAFRESTQWRVVSAVAYLNNLRKGGETEFIFVGRSISPQAGKVLVFPSFYGCVHRSRLAESDPKYIIAAFVGFR
jgi:Rps23 Pro-64 3,4-dihydroxylase Tpa1-like proline 4-hydroxylase